MTQATGPLGPRSKLLSRIQEVLPQLSANDRRLADHLLSRFPRGAWETVETVAKDVGVSKSAVIRFAVRLGYDGFADLQKELQRDLSEVFASPLSLLEASAVSKGENILDEFRKVTLQNLSFEPEQETIDTLSALPEQLLECKGKIYVIGAGRSFGAAHYLHYGLDLLVPNAELMPLEQSALNSTLVDVGEDDIVIAICVRRYASQVVKTLEHCRGAGAFCVSITDSFLGPPRSVSNRLVVVPTASQTFLDSAVVVIFFIEALLGMVAAACKEEATSRLSSLLNIGRIFQTFEDSRS